MLEAEAHAVRADHFVGALVGALPGLGVRQYLHLRHAPRHGAREANDGEGQGSAQSGIVDKKTSHYPGPDSYNTARIDLSPYRLQI